MSDAQVAKKKGFKKKRVIIPLVVVAVAAVTIAIVRTFASAPTGGDLQWTELKKTDIRDTVYVSGTVESAAKKNVYAPSPLKIKEVSVSEGDGVSAGDVLAVLDTEALELDIKQTELNISSMEAAISTEKTGNSSTLTSAQNSVSSSLLDYDSAKREYDTLKEQEGAEPAVVNARTDLDAALRTLESNRLLFDQGEISRDALRQSEDAVKKAQTGFDSTVKNASDALDRAESTLEKAELAIKVAQTNLSAAQSKTTKTTETNLEIQKLLLADKKRQLEDATVTAPVTGTVTLVNAKEDAAANGIMFIIEDTGSLIVKTTIGEFDVGNVALGQKCLIKTDATGDREFGGSVTHISKTARKDASGNTVSTTDVKFETEIGIDRGEKDILIGMNARIYIVIDERSGVLAVPYELLSDNDDGSSSVFVLNDGAVSAREIRIEKGLQTDIEVEVSSPELSEGMRLVTKETAQLLASGGAQNPAHADAGGRMAFGRAGG